MSNVKWLMVTPQQSYPALAGALGLSCDLCLKREDLHPYGSHKGRSIPRMIDTYVAKGIRDFVISSSGNAALAAATAAKKWNKEHPDDMLSLKIFTGQDIEPDKLQNLKEIELAEKISVNQVKNPKQQAFFMDKQGVAKNLRQSTDDLALVGYRELAAELNEIHCLQAVFIPTSSGATAQALGEAFRSLNQKLQIHVVQTTACHPIANLGNLTSAISHCRSPKPEVRSLATAIVDHIAHRKQKVIEVVNNSKGSGWIVTDEEIQEAMKLVDEACDIAISPNSALSVAGLKKASQNGWRWNGTVVCLITGR